MSKQNFCFFASSAVAFNVDELPLNEDQANPKPEESVIRSDDKKRNTKEKSNSELNDNSKSNNNTESQRRERKEKWKRLDAQHEENITLRIIKISETPWSKHQGMKTFENTG